MVRARRVQSTLLYSIPVERLGNWDTIYIDSVQPFVKLAIDALDVNVQRCMQSINIRSTPKIGKFTHDGLHMMLFT